MRENKETANLILLLLLRVLCLVVGNGFSSERVASLIEVLAGQCWELVGTERLCAGMNAVNTREYMNKQKDEDDVPAVVIQTIEDLVEGAAFTSIAVEFEVGEGKQMVFVDGLVVIRGERDVNSNAGGPFIDTALNLTHLEPCTIVDKVRSSL